MVKFDTGEFYREAESNAERFGLLPLLARRYIGRLLSESFCERVISIANKILTKQNTLLNCKDVENMCVLRMNKQIIAKMDSVCVFPDEEDCFDPLSAISAKRQRKN